MLIEASYFDSALTINDLKAALEKDELIGFLKLQIQFSQSIEHYVDII